MRPGSIFRLIVFFSLCVLTRDAGCAQMVFVNGASLQAGQPLAPGSFATVYGQNLCPQTIAAHWIGPAQLPTTLGTCSLTVGGVPAMLHYVSPGQVNFIVPESVPPGNVDVTVHNGSGVVSGRMMVGAAGPGMFALTGMGMGEGAMLHATLWRLPPFSVTTNGAPTFVAIYVTGLDLSMKPVISIGGVLAEVTWWGNAPGFAGLQQINIKLPASVAGAGRAPVTVTSNGVTSNVTYMTLLPTNNMMAGMPGWGPGMMMQENMPRGHEMAYLAFNAASNTALVTDANDDVVRVISLASGSTTATITLPSKSVANAIAVDSTGRYAAVALSAHASIALIDLTTNTVAAVIGTGYYPSHVAFSGSTLLVTNGASSTVSVIDTTSRVVTRTVSVGIGPSGIAALANTAVVANFQEGSLSLINLTDFTTTTVPLPSGSRPHEVAISVTGQAVITNPMSNRVFVLDLSTMAVNSIDIGAWNAMGPSAVATSGSLAYIANQMSRGVTVLDLSADKALDTFTVDPGPRALAVNSGKNQLLVLAEGTGTLDIVGLDTLSVLTRLNAGSTDRQGTWVMPIISSVSPNAAAAGSTFTLTISGSNFQSVQDAGFYLTSASGGGMMGGGNGMMGREDPAITVSGVQVNAAGTEITAVVQVLTAASPGPRQLRLETNRGEVMGMMSSSLFTITSN